MSEQLTKDDFMPFRNFIEPEQLRGFIKEAISKLGPEISKEQKKEYGKLLVKIYEKGMTPKEAMEITN